MTSIQVHFETDAVTSPRHKMGLTYGTAQNLKKVIERKILDFLEHYHDITHDITHNKVTVTDLWADDSVCDILVQRKSEPFSLTVEISYGCREVEDDIPDAFSIEIHPEDLLDEEV